MPGLYLGIESVSCCPRLGGSGDLSALTSGINVTNMKFSVTVDTFNCLLRIHSTVPRVANTYKGYKGEVRGFYGLRGSELCEAILSRLTNCAAIISTLAPTNLRHARVPAWAAPGASTNVRGHDCGAVLTELAFRDAIGDGSPTDSPRAHGLLDGMHILLS
ncbi:predicted protein [Histoplasma capsulatum var. duboisii H88]|uniref:Predicted protein n=1 Tax=Ajellomyces capsulatus (strain H88) TaxID=544711 RepID=F0UR42_AJEC8|nr:predicted protein [Histoplasma capsulatum var. duboisii H88]QSS50395.1 hypothetical protein I7I53_11073 [Histoplasma capsulatum var. duboisii H88]